VESQIRDLTEVVERGGWSVVEIYRGAGTSGAKDVTQRPGIDATKSKNHYFVGQRLDTAMRAPIY